MYIHNVIQKPHCQVTDAPTLARGDGGRAVERGRGACYPSHISKNTIDQIEVYPATVRIKRPFHGKNPEPPNRAGNEIPGFSENSRRRLRFLAANSADQIATQFCLTYHDFWPVDGREFKRQLNLFLTRVRQKYPQLAYIWIGEFQTRGAPHAHFYSNLPVTPENWRFLAETWNHIAEPGNQIHRMFHMHHKNFIPWKMGTGSYLCKYLDKTHQKAIPDGFRNFGRWWGNSRNLKPQADLYDPEEIETELGHTVVDVTTGEITEEFDPVRWIIRQVGRHHEKYCKKSFFRNTDRTSSNLTGAPIFRQCLDYLRRQPPPPQPSPF